MDNENRKLKRNNDAHVKPHSAFLLVWLDKLAAAYRQEITEETQAMYLQNLSDLQPSRLAEAFNRAIRECKFFPTVAEIRTFEAEVEIPKERIEAAYQRRKEQVLATPQPPPMLSAVLDKEQPKPKRPLRLLTEAEHEERVAYLKKQLKPE